MANCSCLQHFDDLLISTPLFLDHVELVPGIELAIFWNSMARWIWRFIVIFRIIELSSCSGGIGGAILRCVICSILVITKLFADFWILFHRQDELKEAVLVQIDGCWPEEIDNVLSVIHIKGVLNTCDGHDHIEIQSQFVDALDEPYEDRWVRLLG